MILFYIRHGRPSYNPDQLKPAGKRQAESVAHRLALSGIDRIFASSSNRAIETAQPTADICEKPVEIMDWCNESYAWQNMTAKRTDGSTFWAYCIPEYRKLFVSSEISSLGDQWTSHPAFSGLRFQEGINFTNSHCDEFLKDLGFVHDRKEHCFHQTRENNERIALFAHEGFGMLFLSSILDIPYPIFCTHFGISYSSVTMIEFKKDVSEIVVPIVHSFANDGHLYADHLPRAYQGRPDF